MVPGWSRRRWALVLVVMALLGVGLAFVIDYAASNRGAIEQGRARDVALGRDVAALRHALGQANQRLREAGKPPVPVPTVPPQPPPAPPAGDTTEKQQRERQQAERQQAEHQQPEHQERERQQPERQQGEVQNAETDDADPDDPETQDEEIQEDENQEPEIQEDEIQNEEIDDPDPNSALNFAVDDQCNPADGEFVTDVSASWQRSPGTVTLVLTCTSAAVPAGLQP